jgi:hypothetical protein
MNEESLNKKYQSALKAIAVCNDIRVMQRYIESITNEWAAYKQANLTFEKFLEDVANVTAVTVGFNTYTPLDDAVADRLFKLYESSIDPDDEGTPFFVSEDNETIKCELYSMLKIDRLDFLLPQFKRYT